MKVGLDTVELVLAIEEEFGIDIPDRDAEKITTVGDCFEWLKTHLATADPTACLTQRVFYQLRRALIQNYGIDRRLLTPQTRLSDLMPLNEIEEAWPFLQLFTDLNTPPFRTANEMLGFRLSGKTLTMRELVYLLIKLNEDRFQPERESEKQIWNRLVDVFVRQTNIDRREITLGASITRDLGLD